MEDLGDADILEAFHDVVHGLLQLNDSTVVDVLTSDGIFEGVVGALACECG